MILICPPICTYGHQVSNLFTVSARYVMHRFMSIKLISDLATQGPTTETTRLPCAKMFVVRSTTGARQTATFAMRQAIKRTANKSARYK